MARVPLVAPDAIAPVLHRVYDLAGRAGPVPELYQALANSPDVLVAWTKFAWPLRALDSTPRALRELVILRVAQLVHSDYEWQHHLPMATRAGITPEQIEGLRAWVTSSLFSDAQRAALGVADAIVGSGDVDDESLAALTDAIGPTGVVDVTVTAAWYLAVARVVATLGPFAESESH